MAPVGQYVFAEMWSKSEQCTAGSHEWLPYSRIQAFLIILKVCRNCQLSIVNSAKPLNTNLSSPGTRECPVLGEMPGNFLKIP